MGRLGSFTSGTTPDGVGSGFGTKAEWELAVAVVTATDGPRRFIGCDRNEEKVKIARHRVSVLRTELRVVLEDAEELEPRISKQQVREFWTYLTDCHDDGFASVLLSLPENHRSIYERLPDVAA